LSGACRPEEWACNCYHELHKCCACNIVPVLYDGESINIATDIASDMSASVIPRGFSRFYVLSLLAERPMTGKEIMEQTGKMTKGAWKPSPGLVYPLLGKLLSLGLIEELEGRYTTTSNGVKALGEYGSVRGEFQKRFDTFVRLGLFGRVMAQDVVDRLTGLMDMVREDISRMGNEQRAKYRAFLLGELTRLEENN